MQSHHAIAIVGPNGVGKTAVAFAVARRLGGEIVNLDKMYTFKRFPLSTGLSDTLKERGVKMHLYEFLEPDQAIVPPAQYAAKVRDICERIGERAAPVIEGGSTTYFPALYELNSHVHFCTHIFGLDYPSERECTQRMQKRVAQVMEEGLLNEVRANLPRYRDTLMMRDAHFVVPLVRYLDGCIDFASAKQGILDRCVAYARQQQAMFNQHPGIRWLKHDPNNPSASRDQILKEIGS